ncbi:Chemotaxis signal transduction protein [Candidatus Nitrosarchaeum limnium SFB1]|jgi:purine-binding chemotaxis protein CheW|uniref:Chemotaxis signal transduction protein n=1 Tax=Candidatus Nitrosarchaeum limnium SFB1 TaxID=886738 RepID=F3KJ25_9ARCH|nr:Chemotaxis signal transduction protein [Candidatus Nitrosarchaeum limnium SFB1]
MSTEIVINDILQVVSFTVAEKSKKKGNYCISIDQVKEIRIVDTITKIPKSKPYVKGLMNLRGKIIPVIDVNSKLGLGETIILENSKQRILVTDVNNTLTGLLVDEVNDVIKISSKDIDDVPSNMFADNDFFKGIVKINENIIMILDIEKLLNYSNYTDNHNDSSNQIGCNLKNSKDMCEINGITPEIDELVKQEINK